ncbi:hypothetical protein KIPB_002884 [Kipferlia bialata]|uniref:Uncharacterized protein n=1 Tax=Kipferlia bialata TaxID=797122 RepID=A0A9K3GGJ4_9EUKA|nr:hypothetical protein KIPB_002884 [Kipferlia bialata]|eukprot:g2884.t1
MLPKYHSTNAKGHEGLWWVSTVEVELNGAVLRVRGRDMPQKKAAEKAAAHAMLEALQSRGEIKPVVPAVPPSPTHEDVAVQDRHLREATTSDGIHLWDKPFVVVLTEREEDAINYPGVRHTLYRCSVDHGLAVIYVEVTLNVIEDDPTPRVTLGHRCQATGSGRYLVQIPPMPEYSEQDEDPSVLDIAESVYVQQCMSYLMGTVREATKGFTHKPGFLVLRDDAATTAPFLPAFSAALFPDTLFVTLPTERTPAGVPIVKQVKEFLEERSNTIMETPRPE